MKTILQISPGKQTLYTIPDHLYDLVCDGMRNPMLRVPTMSGRSKAPTVEQIIDLLPKELQQFIESKDVTQEQDPKHDYVFTYYEELTDAIADMAKLLK